MKIISEGIVNGYIQDRFGKFAEESDKIQGVPMRSLPVAWSELPSGTQSIAVVMQDYDAVPVCGFSWIHWLVADVDPNQNGLVANASREKVDLIQGKSSLASKQLCGELPDGITNFYGGPRPPDKDHEYEITVYALDKKLGLQNGFRLNELLKAMRGHILESVSIHGMYRAE